MSFRGAKRREIPQTYACKRNSQEFLVTPVQVLGNALWVLLLSLEMTYRWSTANAFFWPLLVLNTETLYTLPLGVIQFSTQYSTDYGRVLASVSVSMVPAIIFYFFAERQIVSDLTSGAIMCVIV